MKKLASLRDYLLSSPLQLQADDLQPATLEAREPSALRRRGVDRPHVRRAAARMDDVVGAARHTAAVPAVVEVDVERRVDRDVRVQAVRRLPRPVANAGHELAVGRGRQHRHLVAVADHLVALVGDADTDPFLFFLLLVPGTRGSGTVPWWIVKSGAGDTIRGRC